VQQKTADAWSAAFRSITKPQAMLVDETSDSVETVKKEPPFAKISTGNANRTTKQKEVHPNGREKFITY
jgi:hypothetical protein